MKEMHFWEYDDSSTTGIKCKKWVKNMVAEVHSIFRKNLGYVDEADVKATVMGLTSERSAKWHQTQFQFLVERCVSSAARKL